MSRPIVSIVMPSFNASSFILPSIESVVSQTFTHWELIIVDDASRDGTVDCIAAEYSHDPRIKVFELPTNQGAAVARNTAIEAACGRFIAFLDCDDQWLPHKLERQLDFMLSGDYAFSFTAYEKINQKKEVVASVGVPLRTSYRSMLRTSVVGCSTAMYDTQYFGKVFMPLVRMRQDFGLWLALLKLVPYGYGIQDVLVRYNVRSESISSNKRKAALYTWRVYREVENLPLPIAVWYFGHYAFRGFLRHRYPRLAQRLGLLQQPT